MTTRWKKVLKNRKPTYKLKKTSPKQQKEMKAKKIAIKKSSQTSHKVIRNRKL